MKRNYSSALITLIFMLIFSISNAQKPTGYISGSNPTIEGDTYTFQVRLSASSSIATIIEISTIADTADESDYTPLTSTITIPAGQISSSNISIQTTDDFDIESNEFFKIIIKSNNITNSNLSTNVIITDNDTTPTLKNPSGSYTYEGKSLNFNYYLSNPYHENVDIKIETNAGIADASDFTAISKTVTIPKGQTSVSVIVNASNDNIVETDETFTLTGTVTSGKTTNPTTLSYITIIDDDTLPTLILSGNSTNEGQSSYNSIKLNRLYNSDVTFKLETSNGTADNTDFTPVNTVTKTIKAGSTSTDITIPTFDDTLDEPVENFILNATVTSGNTSNTTATATVEINDNDGLPDLKIYNIQSAQNGSIAEGQKVIIGLRLSQANTTPTTVEITATNGTADESDYKTISATVTIPPGTTYYNSKLEIPIISDNFEEETETFTINGVITSGNTLNTNASATFFIKDDYNLNAQNDNLTLYYKDGTLFNLLNNDTLYGLALNFADVTLSLSPNQYGISMNSEGVITMPANLQIGNYKLSYTVCEIVNPNNCDTAIINLNIYSPLNVSGEPTYVDYNGDGYTSAGDIYEFRYKITNKGNETITNITPDNLEDSFSPFIGTFIGNQIAVLNTGETDTTTFKAIQVISQDDINFNSIFTYSLKTFKGVYHDEIITNNADFSSMTYLLKISDGIKLNAFIDNNANGTQDQGEISFPKGKFNYEINSDGIIHNLYSNPFYLYESNPTTQYNLTYQIDEKYSDYFSTTTTYPNITVAKDSGITTYNFPITVKPYNDLSVNIHNGGAAPRPGFKYYNTISYTNNSGQMIPSGTVTFTKDTAVSILEISEPNATKTDTGFTFNFSNLLPFETRTIKFQMQVPTIPTVTLGQLVTNNASITIPDNDVQTENNTSALTQTIVGSYDPNEKSESHGDKITYSKFTSDDFLTYTIRFENKGTASAINIKVEDVLDSKLDPTSVKMIEASHPYALERINNKLTWNFFGIDLSPSKEDDATTGHGYIVFEVKPKAGFALGDMIPNSANIYFDFNPAIVTNTWTTEFAPTLSVNKIENTDFVFYPNPTQNTFYISLKNNSDSIDSITVNDVLGKIVLTKNINQSKAEMDLSKLSKGIYFVKVKAKGSENTIKIIKE